MRPTKGNGTSEESRARDEAEAWIVRLESSACTPEDRRDFERWLDRSRVNLDAYLATEELHQGARALARDPAMRVAARDVRINRPWSATKPWFALAAAASLGALAVLGYWARPFLAGSEVQHYSNGVGLPREVRLTDGTLLGLDAGTDVAVSTGRRGTAIELARGRIFLSTSNAASGALTVNAGPGIIQDIGTVFEVDRRRTNVVRVSVFDGAVHLSMRDSPASPIVLHPGERAGYSSLGEVGAVETFDAGSGPDWMLGKLVFRDERLDAIVEEMNRYSAEKIVLEGDALPSLRVSGAFQAGDQRALLALLRRGWNLRAHRGPGNDLVVRADGKQ